jgi:hypothetical protein
MSDAAYAALLDLSRQMTTLRLERDEARASGARLEAELAANKQLLRLPADFVNRVTMPLRQYGVPEIRIAAPCDCAGCQVVGVAKEHQADDDDHPDQAYRCFCSHPELTGSHTLTHCDVHT